MEIGTMECQLLCSLDNHKSQRRKSAMFPTHAEAMLKRESSKGAEGQTLDSHQVMSEWIGKACIGLSTESESLEKKIFRFC